MKSQLFSFLVIFITAQTANAGAVEDLFTAAAQCDKAGVEKALGAGADVNSLNSAGQNVLASSFLCEDLTAFLLEKGCDPNGGNYPAIIQAANNYSVDVMKMLLKAGADPNKTGMIDPGAGLRKMIADEKAKGKKANKATIGVWENALKNLKPTEVTALLQTVQQTNCVPCLQLLIDNGVTVNTDNPDNSAIHRLVNFSMTAAERKEAFSKGSPIMESYGFKMPTWYSNLPNDINGSPGDMLNLLVKAGADVNEKRPDGMTAFTAALRLKKLDLSKAMINNGGDGVSASTVMVGKRSMTNYPLNMAAEFADVDLFNAILDQNPDLNTTIETASLGVAMDPSYKGNVTFGGDGYTPLIIAIMSGNVELANLLLDKGASIKIGSSGIAVLKTKISFLHCLTEIKNKTPIYWAVELDDKRLVERIAEAMEWKFNPDFSIKQYGGSKGAGTIVWKCAKFKKKQSPSIYATTVGNMEAAGFLMSKGL